MSTESVILERLPCDCGFRQDQLVDSASERSLLTSVLVDMHDLVVLVVVNHDGHGGGVPEVIDKLTVATRCDQLFVRGGVKVERELVHPVKFAHDVGLPDRAAKHLMQLLPRHADLDLRDICWVDRRDLLRVFAHDLNTIQDDGNAQTCEKAANDLPSPAHVVSLNS